MPFALPSHPEDRTATRRTLHALAGLLLLTSRLHAQNTLSGSVHDPAGAPIADARIRVVEAAREAVTTADGTFRLGALPSGTHRVTVIRVGFQPATHKVTIGERPATLAVTLEPAVLTIEPLQVTATALPTSLPDAPQAIAVLDADELRRVRAPSLGETVQAVPGVQNYGTGPGIGKPAVRGLAGNRVLVVSDGQRLEFQQWGEEHAPSLELQDAAAVEVVRGPASVLYGSDALGGVVNVVARPLPDATAGAPALQGRMHLGFTSGIAGPEASASAEGAVGAFGWRAQLGAMGGSDLRTPSGRLNNSGFRSLAGVVSGGVRGGWGTAQVTLTHKDERFEVAEDPAVDPAYTGFQEVRTDRVRADGRVPLGRQRLELGVGVERNERSEFDRDGATDAVTGLLATLVTADARFFHAPLGPFEGAAGVSFSRLGFEDFGAERFLPDYDWWNVGVYAFEQASLGPLSLAAGLRLDHRVQDAAASALAPAGEQRDWTALSGNLGVVVPLGGDVSVVANAGRGFRAPQPTELYANGIHQGTLAFEVGDPSLGVERSFNLEAGLRWHGHDVVAEANVFRNAVDGFIYYRPTGEREPASGFEIFRFTQGEALLTGFEASVRWRPARRVELMLGGDATRGTNRSLDVPLPFMPPLRALYGVALDDVRLPFLGKGPRAAIALRGESMARQSRPDPEEVAPPGFTRLDLETALSIPSRRGELTLDVQLRNLTDASYVRPLNRFKGFAREMGRNVVVRVGVPF